MLLAASRRISGDATVAIAPHGNDLLSPYFGERLTRRVELVLSERPIPPEASWLIAAPGVRPLMPRPTWQIVLRTPCGWVLARRTVPKQASLRLRDPSQQVEQAEWDSSRAHLFTGGRQLAEKQAFDGPPEKARPRDPPARPRPSVERALELP